MPTTCPALTVLLLCALPFPAGALPALTVQPVDSLVRIYPDQPPPASPPPDVLHIPPGGHVSLQVAIQVARDCSVTLAPEPITRADGRPLVGHARVAHILPVHVEANTQGSMKTRPGGTVPEGWMASFVREAPYDVAEVVTEASSFRADADQTHAALLEVSVARACPPGPYQGGLRVSAGEATSSVPFRLVVHRTPIPAHPAIHVTHWFWPEPVNLATGAIPGWWSERHWRLIEHSGRQLRRLGQETILNPLVNHRESLIRIIRGRDGKYRFDFTRFDRWIALFDRLGFRVFEGAHIISLPTKAMGGVWVRDAATGKAEPLPEAATRDKWLEFLPIFYAALGQHLKEHAINERYIQHQLDEPGDPEIYQRLAELARTHLPGVRTVDAINKTPDKYSPLVDIQVFALQLLPKNEALAAQRRDAGQSSWLYHCTSPYPPYPNRHLDRPLSESRLYPWLAFWLRAEGYLFWAANMYRGADEYRTSIGPLPNGSQDPGHPPGDAWMMYRGPDGLRASMRMLAFRDGLEDHALLTMLAREDPERADRIRRRIVRTCTNYEKSPGAYHRTRRALLTELDRLATPSSG